MHRYNNPMFVVIELANAKALEQWFPPGEEFLPREEFYNFKGGILQVLFCEGQWFLNCELQLLGTLFFHSLFQTQY